MNNKRNSKQEEQEKLEDFYTEIEQVKTEKAEENKEKTINRHGEGVVKLPYKCPHCHAKLASRKEPCKRCGYSGYIPLSTAEIVKTRLILFIILAIVAVIVYLTM